MSKKKTATVTQEAPKAEEVVTEVVETAAVVETKEEKTEEATKVYCGPSVRGVVRQYTVFKGDISELLKAFIKDHPIAESLLVDVKDFAETRKALSTKGSAQAILFDKLRKEL